MTNSLKLRDSMVSIIRGLINRERPLPRVAEVYTYDRFTRIAEILLPGETLPGLSAKFPPNLQPTRAKRDDGTGNIVLVEGGLSNYRITQILDSDAMGTRMGIDQLALVGGKKQDRQMARHFSREVDLPGAGASVHLGRFYFTHDGDYDFQAWSAQVELVVQSRVFYGGSKVYRFAVDNSNTTATWKNLFSNIDSGFRYGNDFSVEINVPDDHSFELRIRNVRSNSTAPPQGYTFSMWLYGQDWEYDDTNYNTFDAGVSPGSPFRTDDTATSETTDGWNVQQGPFFMPNERIVHGRTWENLTGGGTVTWDDRYVKWTSNFVAAIGRSNLITTGVVQIPVPTVGQSIYYHGLSGVAATIAYTSSGVDMMPVATTHTVLYYAPDFGSSDGAGGRFHVVGMDLNFKVPSHWIMIAVMNQNANHLKVANGQLMSPWVNVTPAAGWAHSAYTGVANAQCRKVDNRVFFRGSLTSGANSLTAAATTVICQVPSGYYNGALRNFKAVGTTGGFLGWANVTDVGDFQVHFKSPYVTASGVIIDLSGMTYLLD